MKLTKGKKVLIGIIIGIWFSITTIYAAPNVQQHLVLWGQTKSNEAKLQVQTNLYGALEHQISKLSDDNNSYLNQLIKKLEELSGGVSIRSFNSINASLDVHMKEIEESANFLNNEMTNDFKQIIRKVNAHTDGIIESIEDEAYQGIQASEYPKIEIDPESSNNSNLELDVEIQLTYATINELEELMENEPNQAIKDYIQKKINILNDLVYQLKRN